MRVEAGGGKTTLHRGMMSPFAGQVKRIARWASEEAEGAEAAVAGAADADMVVDGDPQLCRGLGVLAGDRDLLARRSVGSGKSWAVRVGPVGLRTLQKTQPQYYNT